MDPLALSTTPPNDDEESIRRLILIDGFNMMHAASADLLTSYNATSTLNYDE